ncbi:MAG: hypothetical protein ABJA76_06000 [Mucilaginibacter sp.]
MKKIIKLLTPALLAAVLINTSTKATAIPTDTNKYWAEVKAFVPGEIPGVANRAAAPAFSPDGKSVYFGTSPVKDITIMASYCKDNKWTEPVIAPFSGGFHNLEPAFAPNGKYLVFASNRPTTTDGPVIDGYWGKKNYPGNGGNLWKVDLTKKGWGEPRRLPDVINQNNSIFSPAITADGSIYFMLPDTAGKFHIRRSQYKNGKFETPVRPSFSVDAYGDVDPVVAPNESFLIFSSGRPPALPHTADLFIVFRTPTGWSEPLDLRQLISDKVFGVEARLSPDLKTLYFSNQRNAAGVTVNTDQYIWQVNISKILKAHGL